MVKAGNTNMFFFAFKYVGAKSCEVRVYLLWLELPAGSNPSRVWPVLPICEPVPASCWSFPRVNTGLFVFLWVLAV